MHQTRYRAALGAAPSRPSYQLGLGTTPYSRVQPTAFLMANRVLHRNDEPSPFVRAGLKGIADAGLRHGLGSLGSVNWLTQGLALALGSEFISKLFNPPTPAEEAEDLTKLQKAAEQISNPFYKANIAGHDAVVYLKSGKSGFNPRHGLGNTGTFATGVNTATVISAAAIKSGTSLASTSTWLAAAGGPIGLGVAGATVALTYLFTRQRPARKVATTEIVNSVEPLLQQNLGAYLEGPRNPESQAQAIANFEAGWSYVQQACGDPNMGKPGEWCISDRKRGGKHDWFVRYLDPIINDPEALQKSQAQPNQTMQYQTGTGSIATAYASQAANSNVPPSNGISPVLLLAGLVFAGVVISRG